LEPALGKLDEDVRREVSGPGFQAMDEEHRKAALSEIYYDRLTSIQERASEPLVRTKLAWYVARDHLLEVAGLALPESND
jgi:hypothetical protein